MQTASESIYPIYYSRFEKLAHSIEAGDTQSSQDLVVEIEQLLNIDHCSPQYMQAFFFHQAFIQRLHSGNHQEAENLYLVNDNGQQIKQFNFMAEKFPVVTHAQEIVNTLFMEALGKHKEFTFIDIGIGSAQQVIRLIRQLQGAGKHLAKITVIGIEPSLESLEKAQMSLESLSRESKTKIDFIRLNSTLEQLSAQDWKTLKHHAISSSGPLFINASFALHHVPIEVRAEMLSHLRQLDPDLFMIIEPYSDHTLSSLIPRFRNAWHHYGLTFQAIDSIEAPEEEKEGAKRVFFGREILDVIRESNRIEQFETAEMWLTKLENAGFSIYSSIQQFDILSFNSIINRRLIHDYIGMNVGDFPIVAIMGVH